MENSDVGTCFLGTLIVEWLCTRPSTPRTFLLPESENRHLHRTFVVGSASRKKQREDVDVVGASDGEGAIGLSNDHKSREQMINDRIGYKPQPKPNNRSSQFGSFEF
ncbi:unnamed protein product [Lepidochelys olivacea]